MATLKPFLPKGISKQKMHSCSVTLQWSMQRSHKLTGSNKAQRREKRFKLKLLPKKMLGISYKIEIVEKECDNDSEISIRGKLGT